jgi:hypothetical protein
MKKVEIRKYVGTNRFGEDISIVLATRVFDTLEAGLRWAFQRINGDPMYWVTVDGKEVRGD